MKFSNALEARISGLGKLTAVQIKKIAEPLGIERDSSNQSWSDLAQRIAIAEFERDGKNPYQPSSPTRPVIYQNWIGRAEIGGNSDKIRTDLAGRVVNPPAR